MKRIILPILFIGIFVLSFSQTRLFMGPGAGLNLNRVKFSGAGYGSSNSDIFVGFSVGAPLEVRFNDFIALQSGLMYAQRGGVDKVNETKLVLHQLEIPLYVKGGYGKDDKWQVYGIGGFKFGAGLKGTYIDKSIDLKENQEYGGSYGLKKGYLGLVMGLGYSVQLGPGKLVTDFSYDMAVTKVYRGEFFIGGDVTRRQKNLNFGVSYLFWLNGKD